MNTVPVSEIFDVKYGQKLDFRNMVEVDGGVNFVTRSRRNLGVGGQVQAVAGVKPHPPGAITVSLGGTYLLSAFVQPAPFYTAQNIKVLVPKKAMSFREKVFYCTCITANRFRYSTHGREANRSFDGILVPARSSVPKWISMASPKLPTPSFTLPDQPMKTVAGNVPLSSLFELSNGQNTADHIRSELRLTADFVPLIRPSKGQESSFVEYVDKREVPAGKVFPAGTLYVSTNGQGSHTYAYVSTFEFVPNIDVVVLRDLNGKMSLGDKLYYAACISANRWKFSYGRKPKGDRLADLLVPASVPNFARNADLFGRVMTDLAATTQSLA
ncbi:restriction endonuclease subunit S [Mesorhizobium sp. M0814]|uniref:hypothetical protein n=1 Tax=Mesorhizobium sp. M0814 TaxID=2957004 RepID=UPI0033390805